MIKQFESRKWTLAVYVALVGTIAMFTGYIIGAEWVNLMIVDMSIYGAANSASKFATRRSDHGE